MNRGTQPLLNADNLSIARGDALVIEGLSLAVFAGDAVHVTGENGAGKSTLLLALCGLIPLAAGQVHFDRDQIAFLGHDNGLLPDLSVAENLALYARSGAGASLEVQKALGVDALLEKPAKTLSFGQARRVALALTCLENRGLWLLDEPFAGLDRQTADALEALLTARRANGVGLIFSSHERSLNGAATLHLSAAWKGGAEDV